MAEVTTDDGVTIVSSDPAPVEPQDTQDGAPASTAESIAVSPPATESPPESDDDDRPVSPRELRRIVGRFTRQRTDLEAQLGTVRAQNETLMRMLQPPPPQVPAEPQGPPEPPDVPISSDYDSDEAYRAAQRTYKLEQAKYLDEMVTWRLNEREGQQRQRERAHVQQQSEEELNETIRARERDIIASTAPDYYDRFREIGPQLGDVLVWGLKQAGELGPDLVLHLHAHQDLIPALRQVPPSRIGIELGKLLGGGRAPTQSTPPTQSRTTPSPSAPLGLPEPPQLVSGGGGSATPAYSDSMTQAQFDAWSKRMYPEMPFTQKR